MSRLRKRLLEGKNDHSHGGILDYYLTMLLEVPRLFRSYVSLKKNNTVTAIGSNEYGEELSNPRLCTI